MNREINETLIELILIVTLVNDWLDIASFLQYIKSEMIGHMFTISKECIMSNKLYSFVF